MHLVGTSQAYLLFKCFVVDRMLRGTETFLVPAAGGGSSLPSNVTLGRTQPPNMQGALEEYSRTGDARVLQQFSALMGSPAVVRSCARPAPYELFIPHCFLSPSEKLSLMGSPAVVRSCARTAPDKLTISHFLKAVGEATSSH